MNVYQSLLVNVHFITLIHPIQWTIALPVGTTGPTKHQKEMACIYYQQDQLWIEHLPGGHRTSFLPTQRDVIASFSFCACSVQTCF